MRLFPIFAVLLATCAAACSSQTQEVLPLSRAIIGASRIETVQFVIQPTARAALALLDERAAKGGEAGASGQPFQQMLEAAVRDAATRADLVGGRALRLILDLDQIQVPGSGAAMFGKEDRLAGTVFVRDAGSGEPLGQLYVDVRSSNAGLVGLALRGGGVRERLAGAFAERIAGALSGRKPPR